MPNCRWTRVSGLAATLVACVGVATAAQTSRGSEKDLEVALRLLTIDGKWTACQLRAANAERWSVVERGTTTERAIRTADLVAFTIDRNGASFGSSAGSGSETEMDAPAPLSFGMLETASGQRLPGNLRFAIDTNFWDHRWIGAIPLAPNLDAGGDSDPIASIRLRGAKVPARRTDGDTILLLNGDTMTGFIEKLGADVDFTPLAAGDEAKSAEPATRRISTDRIAAIALAKSDRVRGNAPRIWAIDGSVVDGSDIAFDPKDGWGFRLADPLLAKVRASRTTDNNAANPLAALFAPSRFVPLASLPRPTNRRPEGQFHFGIDGAARIGATERALLGLAPIELAGPVATRFEFASSSLPSDAQAGDVLFSCELALAEPAPRDVRVEVDVTFGSAKSAHLTLDGRTRRAPIVLRQPLGQSAGVSIPLEFTLTDGGNGLAGDAIVIERACFIAVPR